MFCLLSFSTYFLLNYFGAVLQSINVIIILQNHFLSDILFFSIFTMMINLVLVTFISLLAYAYSYLLHTFLTINPTNKT